MKRILSHVTVVMLAIFFLTACAGDKKSYDPGGNYPPASEDVLNEAIKSDVSYINYDYGFSLEFPASWENKFGVETVIFKNIDEWSVEVFHTATRDEMGHGWLFNIACAPGEGYTEDEPPVMSGWCVILAQTGGRTYFAFTPSGVEYNEDPESETGIEYIEMSEQIADIIESFILLYD